MRALPARAEVEVPPARLAPRERILLYLYRFLSAHGYSPGAEAVSTALGWSPNNASHHLERLRELGLVTWGRGERGTLTLTREGAAMALGLEAARAQEVLP